MEERVSAQLALLLRRYPALCPLEEELKAAYEMLKTCYAAGGKLIVGGNGGSCADAEHMVGELMKGFKLPRRLPEGEQAALRAADLKLGADLCEKLQGGLPSIALSAHPALNTAYLNDVCGETMYAQQLYVLGRPGDVFLGISTSGNAQNVCYAAVAAKARGMRVLALSGKTGGALKALADLSLIMPSSETYQIQELHLPVYHCLCLMLEEHFFGSHLG